MRVDLPPWPSDLPADAIRAEARAMADAWVETLTGMLPEGAIRGIYLKGSANRPWDTAIDYVPERSDVDIHIALRSADDERPFDDLAFALDIATRVERAYDARVSLPLHRPKPQLTFVSALHALADYVPSPPATVLTLAGDAPPALTLDEATRAAQRVRDRENLLGNAAFLDALPRRAVDRPGALIERLVDELSWRVSPVAPRVLSLNGDAYEDVWSLNRSALVRRLEAAGREGLATAFVGYYLAGWRVFHATRGGHGERAIEAMRDALVSGTEVLRLGIAAAEGDDGRDG